MTIDRRLTPICPKKNQKEATSCSKNRETVAISFTSYFVPPARRLKFGLQFHNKLMVHAEECYAVFQKSIDDYHLKDDVDTPANNPFPAGSFESLLYVKNWIDTVQWHLEDIIRNPDIDPTLGLQIKRRIDKSNQDRTDTVERIDDYFLEGFKNIKYNPGARINSETPAWLLDRMSILLLKIYHMKEQTERKDVTIQHLARCREKLAILEEQKEDMRQAFDQLIQDIGTGTRRFKVYRQMKMYNDATLNPVLYNTAPGTQANS